ncbi:hypothetical protein VNO77_19125 [Canavalia gladiata]|uniref:Uncharacterized protein n=1 Tax=Canavalia gladiata TaxID=3824 RepID=A0AAN9LS03_CANGL
MKLVATLHSHAPCYSLLSILRAPHGYRLRSEAQRSIRAFQDLLSPFLFSSSFPSFSCLTKNGFGLTDRAFSHFLFPAQWPPPLFPFFFLSSISFSSPDPKPRSESSTYSMFILGQNARAYPGTATTTDWRVLLKKILPEDPQERKMAEPSLQEKKIGEKKRPPMKTR